MIVFEGTYLIRTEHLPSGNCLAIVTDENGDRQISSISGTAEEAVGLARQAILEREHKGEK